ncbi:MAG: hypothetical protein KDC44_15600, partial [Phaeodactylibacter sp.]|nr:hypothetical protein [Phaeodactylibacter sp.]
MGKAKNMTVSHFWGMYHLPDSIKEPANELKDWPERQAFIQQEVAVSGIDWKKQETGRIATSGEKYMDWEFEFDFKEEGNYVIFCEAQAFVDREFEYVQEPSTAFLIVNVSKAEDIGKEHVSATPSKMDNLDFQMWMAEQSGDHKRAAELAKEIEKLEKEENMTPAELLQSKMGETRKVLQNVEYIYDLWEQYYRRNIPMMGDKDNGPFNIILQERNKEAYELWLVINQMATSKVSPDHILRQMRDNLRKQLEEYRKLDARTYLAEKKGNFKEGGKILRPEVTLVATDGWMDDESGKAYSLFLMLGETADSKPEEGEYEYKLIDLTSPTLSMNDVVFEGEGKSPAEAIHEAFVKFGKESSYPSGKIIYRIPPERETFEVESTIGGKKVLQVSAMVLGMLAMLAGTVATAGALSPALAASVGMVAATMGVTSAIIGGTLAMVDIIERVDKDTAEWDADMILSIIDILGSLVAVADFFVEGLKVTRLIKTANGLAKVEKFEKIVMISDIAELSGTTILVGVKVAQDFDVIDKMPISDAEKAALKNQVISSAVQQGAMILLSGAMVANRAIKDKMDSVQSSKYQSFFDKGWVDKNGRITADAPAYMVKNRPHTPEPEAPTSKV